jgi:hypothetical protein
MDQVKGDSRRIFVAHPWGKGPDGEQFRDALHRVGQELDVDIVFPEENFLATRSLEEGLSGAALSIFDLSEWTPNLAYEFGIANGLDIPTVSILRKDTVGSGPPAFIEGPAEVRYSRFEDLAAQLVPVIQQYVGGAAHGRIDLEESPEANEQEALVAEVVGLLREKDEVSLRELARRERDSFQSKFRSQLQLHARNDDLTGFDAALTPLLARYLAWLLPLVDHRSPLAVDELRVIGRFYGVRPVDSGHRRWVTMTDWATWWLANSLGAFALFAENTDVLTGLFSTPLEADRPSKRVLATVLPETGGVELAEERLREITGSSYWDSTFHYLAQSLATVPFLASRYPSFVESDEILDWLADFNFLGCLHAAKEGDLLVASWAARTSGGEPVVKRIQADRTFREEVAGALGVTSDELIDLAPLWLESILSHGVPGQLASSDAMEHWGGK